MIDESLLKFQGQLNLVGIIVQNNSRGQMAIKPQIRCSQESGPFPMGRGLVKPSSPSPDGHSVAGTQILLGPVVDGTSAFAHSHGRLIVVRTIGRQELLAIPVRRVWQKLAP